MVPAASGVVGVRVAMVPAPLSAPVAGTLAAAPAARRVKLVFFFVMTRRALMSALVPVAALCRSIAPGGGDGAITVGATSVVKLHTEAVPRGVAMVSATVAATVAV